MYLLILMSGKWYAKDYGGESTLRYNIDEVFEHVRNGNVVCVTDDLETWCDEMDVKENTIIIVE